MYEYVVWILVTLIMASTAVILSKKHGIVYAFGMYAGFVVVANVIACKILQFGPMEIPAGFLVYSSTFLITDAISEFWGEKEARRAVWVGFLANIMLVISVWIAVNWSYPAWWTNPGQEAYSAVFGFVPRLVLASMIAYLLSQHHDVWSYNWWKKRTGGKHLWVRNNASTFVSQAIDTTVFITIAFYGIFPIWHMILWQYIAKLLVAILDTPFLYGMRVFFKK
ncbi:MAG: queuosine precursor transporter [Methanophagales archaeon]|nr:queuosine precursor transporter [Methanophagales archaeon]